MLVRSKSKQNKLQEKNAIITRSESVKKSLLPSFIPTKSYLFQPGKTNCK